MEYYPEAIKPRSHSPRREEEAPAAGIGGTHTCGEWRPWCMLGAFVVPEKELMLEDEFNVHASMPAGKSNVAIFTPTQPGTYTFYCRPHADKAARTGMVGTLAVAP